MTTIRWWLHPLFAFRNGIIDRPNGHGGICADQSEVYAVVLADHDEVSSAGSEIFRYRCPPEDLVGAASLRRAALQPKPSIRILRSCTLHSPWAPRVGIRYEGL